MGYKTIDRSATHADFIFKNTIDKNRCLTRLADTDHAIDGSREEAILTVHDPVGTSSRGAEANPPRLIFNCLLKIRGGC